ncbi:MAG: hypothetical protein WCR20_17965 [Verrucomicrobiota bacterium]
MRYNRNNNLFFAFLMGGLIGILIRLYRERRQACVAPARPQPPQIPAPPIVNRRTRQQAQLPPHIWN